VYVSADGTFCNFRAAAAKLPKAAISPTICKASKLSGPGDCLELMVFSIIQIF
jgi:hypothetical protein